MSKYATSYVISNNMLSLVADIMEEMGKLSDPHSNHSLMSGASKAKLPDPYDEAGYSSSFKKGRVIGDDAKRLFNEQLERLHKDYIDFYLFHAFNKGTFAKMKEYGVFDYLESEKQPAGYVIWASRSTIPLMSSRRS